MIIEIRDPREPFVIMVFLEELLYQCHCVMDSHDELREALLSIAALQNEFDALHAAKAFGMKSMKDVLAIWASTDQSKIDGLIAESRKRTTLDETMNDFKQYWGKYEPIHRRLQRSIEYLILHAGKLALLLFPAGIANPDSNTKRGRRALRGRVLRSVTRTKRNSPLANRALRNTYEHYDERLDLILASVGAYGHRQLGKWYPVPNSQACGFIFDPNSGVVHFLNKTASQEQLNLQPIIDEIDRLMNEANEFLSGLSALEKDLGREGAIKYIDELVISCNK